MQVTLREEGRGNRFCVPVLTATRVGEYHATWEKWVNTARLEVGMIVVFRMVLRLGV